MKEVEGRMVATDLNGENVVEKCKSMIEFLKEKLTELKQTVISSSFDDEESEITFFKHQKPSLLGRLMFYYKVFHIESGLPIDPEQLDDYYMDKQEELKIFFDNNVSFYQYYRSGATYRDMCYFIRGRQGISPEAVHCEVLDNDPQFSTGYDLLVAKITATEMLYAHLSERRVNLKQDGDNLPVELLKKKGAYKWTGNTIELVELAYGINEMRSINNGEAPIHELVAFLGAFFCIDIRDCYSAYTDMKRRKNDSRTYFLDKMRERLNKKMENEDEK